MAVLFFCFLRFNYHARMEIVKFGEVCAEKKWTQTVDGYLNTNIGFSRGFKVEWLWLKRLGIPEN